MFFGYMEDYGCKNIDKLSPFVTTLISRKIYRQSWYPKMSRISTSCPFCTSSYYENIKNPRITLDTEFASRSLTYIPERLIIHNLCRKLFKFLKIIPENLQHTEQRMHRKKISAVKFIKKS